MANYVGTNYPTYLALYHFGQDCTGISWNLYGDDNIFFTYLSASHNGEYLTMDAKDSVSIDLPPRALLRVFADETDAPDVGEVPSTLYGTYFNESLSDN